MSVAGVITLALCCLRVAHTYLTISLNGTWTVSNQNLGKTVIFHSNLTLWTILSFHLISHDLSIGFRDEKGS